MKNKTNNFKVKSKKILYKGHETRYSVTNTGIIINDEKNCIQKPHVSNRGYERVLLSYNGTRKYVSVHRLVAQYFIPNDDNLPEVNHIDGNKRNNNVTNLEWCTAEYNVKHSYDTNLNHSGESNSLATISNKQAKKICKLLEQNKLTMNEIAKEVGTTRKVVSHIKNKESWCRISCQYDIDNYNVKEINIKKGDKHPRSKLTTKKVEKVCQMIEDNVFTLKEISMKTSVPYSSVRNIFYGTVWKDVSSKYDFSHFNKDGRKNK